MCAFRFCLFCFLFCCCCCCHWLSDIQCPANTNEAWKIKRSATQLVFKWYMTMVCLVNIANTYIHTHTKNQLYKKIIYVCREFALWELKIKCWDSLSENFISNCTEVMLLLWATKKNVVYIHFILHWHLLHIT